MESSDSSIHAVLKKYDKKLYIIAVNSKHTPQNIKFNLPQFTEKMQPKFYLTLIRIFIIINANMKALLLKCMDIFKD